MIDSDNIYFYAYYSNKELEFKQDLIISLISSLESIGYKLVDGYAFPFQKPENIIVNKEKLIKSFSLTLAENYGGSLFFWQYPFEFSINISIEPDEGIEWYISVELDTINIDNGRFMQKNQQMFLEVIRQTIEQIPPVYAFMPFGNDDILCIEDAFELSVNKVYPINFFGKSFFENKLSKEQISNLQPDISFQIAEGFFVVPDKSHIIHPNIEKLEKMQLIWD